MGKGTFGLANGIYKGISGIVTEPYKGAKSSGVKGGLKGAAKGIGGVVYRPVKGVCDFVA